jgi:hypothetical protein
MPLTHLELESTDALLSELAGRFEQMIFAGLKFRPVEGDPRNLIRSWRVKGQTETCQGLAMGIIARLQQMEDEHEQAISPEEL